MSDTQSRRKLPFIALLTLGLFLALLGIAVLWLASVNINRFKTDIESLVADNSNTTLSIEGDLSWQLFPSLALAVGRSELFIDSPASQIADAEKSAFAAIDRFSLQLKLIPLLSGNLEAQSLNIDGLQVNLRSDSQGNNWEALQFGNQADNENKNTSSGPDAESDTTEGDGGGSSLSLDSIALNNITLNYQSDQQPTQTFRLRALNGNGVNLQGQPFEIDLDANLDAAKSGQLDTQLKAILAFNQQSQQLELSELDANIAWQQQQGLDPLSLQINAAGKVNLAESKLDEAQFSLATDESSISLTASGKIEAPYKLQGDLNASSEALIKQLNRLAIAAPETADANVLQSASLNTRFAYQQNQLSLEQLNANIDQTQLQGELQLSLVEQIAEQTGNQKTTVPTLDIQLSIDNINIDRYLPPSSSSDGGTAEPTTGGNQISNNTADNSLPLDMLSTFNGNVSIAANTLVASGLSMNDFSMDATLNSSLLTLKQLRADFYQGELVVNGSLNARNKQSAKLNIVQQLNSLQVEPLLADLQSEDNNAQTTVLSGTAETTSRLTMRGNSVSSWLNTLSGETRFNLRDGVYHDSNIEHTVCMAIAGVRNEKLVSQWPKTTPLTTLQGAVNWNNGRGAITTLSGGLNILDVQGNGWVSLPNSDLQLDIDAVLSGDVKGVDEGCEINEKYRDIAWPLQCKGAFDAVSCGIDNERLNKLIEAAAKRDLKRQAEKELEKVIEKEIGGELGEGLEGLLKEGLEGLFK